MKRRRLFGLLPWTILASALAGSCGSNVPVVARAAGHEWTVDQAANLIAPRANLPANPNVVSALANLWVDYTLLATAVAKDSALSGLDVSHVVQPMADSRLLAALRDSVAMPKLVAGLERAADPKLADGAAGVIRTLAQNPHTTLGRRESIRPLLRYRNGEVTEGEALRYLQQQPPEIRNQIAVTKNDSIPNSLIFALARRELLLAEAARRGWSVRSDVRAQLDNAARRNLVEAAAQLGLKSASAATDPKIDQAVSALLSRILSGEQREVTPLGAMSYVLRDKYQSQISAEGVQQAATRIAELRQRQSKNIQSE